MNNPETKVITAAVKKALDQFNVAYDQKINALIANLTDIVARNEHLTERETHARIAAHFARGPLETPIAAGNSQLNGATVKSPNKKLAAYQRRQALVAKRAALRAAKRQQGGES